MGSVRLPQAQLSEITPPKKRDPQTELIMQVLGNNPLAQGINQAAPDITDALAQRAKMRRQTQQIAQLASLTGEDPSVYSQLDPSTATALALSKIKHRQEMEQAATKQQTENYTPDQLRTIQSGSLTGLSNVYPGGVPKEAVNLAATMQNRKSLDLDRNESMRLRETQQGLTESSKDKNRYRNYVLDIEQRDPIVKEVNKQQLSLNSIYSLKDLVQGGNTVAFSGLGIKMAKGMGEVGVMTEKDVTRYVASKQISRKAADTLLGWIKGRPTDATLDEIGDITKAMATAYKENYQPRVDQYIDSYSSIENISPEEFAKKISMSYGGGLKQIPKQEKKATLRWNPRTGKVEPIQ